MIKVITTTASVLSKNHVETLKKAVQKKYGRDAQFEWRVDPKVIGGIKVVIGSKSIDLTVAGKLAQLRVQLEKNLQ